VVGGPWAYGGPAKGCTCGAEPPAYTDTDAGTDTDTDTDTDEPPDSGSGELGRSSRRQGRPQTGRWVRRGRKIVIMGA
jgi:hypothetical protein